jgi:hypothetical protein
MRLVDHQQADARGEDRQHLLAELRVVEPLGADQQQVDGIGLQQRRDLAPRVAVGRVDRVRPQPELAGGVDLVAHQRQQRRDDQRRPRAGLAQQRGRHEVDGRLAPAGSLHAQHPRAVLDQVAHGVELVLAELRLRTGEGVEVLLGAGVDGGAHVSVDGRGRRG